MASFTAHENSFATKVVHAGCEMDVTGSVIPPISLTTTFVQSFPGVKPGYNDPNSHGSGFYYSRQANPSRGALERALTAIERGAKHCMCFSSGMAAISASIQLLKSGDHAVALDDLYGGTSSYFRDISAPGSNIGVTFCDMSDPAVVEAACTPQTKMIYLESPTNPLLKTTDIRAIAAVAKRHNALLVVDGTFMSPYLQSPLELGADIVVHSITKFIAGHSDVLMGCCITNSDELNKRLRFLQCYIGAVPSPFECYLALRGLKTLHIRMDASQRNAIQVANFLEGHPMLESVAYPGLKSYKWYEVSKNQTRGPGAMIAMYIKGGLPVAGKFLQELKVFALAVSLGAVESLACSPAIMTHAIVPVEKRIEIGLTDSMIRLSCGIENGDDLVEDLRQALEKAAVLFHSLQGGCASAGCKCEACKCGEVCKCNGNCDTSACCSAPAAAAVEEVTAAVSACCCSNK